MNKLSIILQQHMVVVFFIYGLSFFLLGLTILLLIDRTSKFKLTPCFWLLALFGLIHGINEWVDMLLLRGQKIWNPVVLNWVMHFSVFLIISSFLFLLAFGIQALASLNKGEIKWLNKIIIFICLLIFTFLMIDAAFLSRDHMFTKTIGILSRYFIGFTGSLLTGLMFLIWGKQAEIKNINSKIVNLGFIFTGGAFILYAFFSGLVVPAASFFPASFLNHANFLKFFKIPIQFFRTLCAFVAAIGIFWVLKMFTYSEKAQLQAIAELDALTQVYSRNFFHHIYLEECARSERYKRPLSILFIDLDDFKSYNDSYGHKAGDVLLKIIAKLLVKETRDADWVFRYGGEEFVILLPESNVEMAVITAERIRQACRQIKLKPKGAKHEVHKTISIGVAAFDLSHENRFLAIDLADKAMYHAKQTGKDKVCVSGAY